jgi:hypothetical protein
MWSMKRLELLFPNVRWKFTFVCRYSVQEFLQSSRTSNGPVNEFYIQRVRWSPDAACSPTCRTSCWLSILSIHIQSSRQQKIPDLSRSSLLDFIIFSPWDSKLMRSTVSCIMFRKLHLWIDDGQPAEQSSSVGIWSKFAGVKICVEFVTNNLVLD